MHPCRNHSLAMAKTGSCRQLPLDAHLVTTYVMFCPSDVHHQPGSASRWALTHRKSRQMELVSAVPTTAVVVRFTLLWTALFAVIRKSLPDRTADFQNRVVSFIHAVEAIIFCCIIVNWTSPFHGVGQATTSSQWWCLAVSLGYFVYDIAYCALVEKSIINTLHHVGTLLGLVVGVYLQQSGTELMLCLLIAEVSNPFMHMRAMLRELDMKDTKLAFYNELAFALTFTVGRIVFGPPLVYKTLTSPTSNIVVKVGGTLIQLVSLLWFYRILQVVARKLGFGKRTARDKSS